MQTSLLLLTQASELDDMAAHMGGSQHGGGGNAPWLDDGARGQLAARVRALEQERERCAGDKALLGC